MLRLVLRRLAILPIALVAVHFLGFSYAVTAAWIHASNNPFVGPSSSGPIPIWPAYTEYLSQVLEGQWGTMGRAQGSIMDAVLTASRATLGLLLIAFLVSAVLGLLLGLSAVRTRPPGAASWLIPISTLGLAMPGFYIGLLLVAALIFYALRNFVPPPLPFDGFGWDRHLVLPVVALAIRPTLQVAQITSRLLGDELREQYVVAERSLGFTWTRIRWRGALRNVLAPIILTVTGAFRYLLGEIVLIEFLFNWPGIGRMLALTLIPPSLSSGVSSSFFLNPRVLSLLLVLFTLLFLLADLFASLLVRRVDPRIAAPEVAHG